MEEFKIGKGRGGQGVAVNWDFVLLLPPVTNSFFLYLYIFVTNKLYSMQLGRKSSLSFGSSTCIK